MSLLPIQNPGQVLQAAAVARTAVSAASSAFEKLLQAATPSDPKDTDDKTADNGDSVPQPTQEALQRLLNRNDDLIGAFETELKQLLAAKGVDISGGLDLQLDEMGSVRVAGDHPQKAIIESVFAAHPELERQFQQLAINAQVIGQLDSNTRTSNGSTGDAAALGHAGRESFMLRVGGKQSNHSPTAAG